MFILTGQKCHLSFPDNFPTSVGLLTSKLGTPHPLVECKRHVHFELAIYYNGIGLWIISNQCGMQDTFFGVCVWGGGGRTTYSIRIQYPSIGWVCMMKLKIELLVDVSNWFNKCRLLKVHHAC